MAMLRRLKVLRAAASAQRPAACSTHAVRVPQRMRGAPGMRRLALEATVYRVDACGAGKRPGGVSDELSWVCCRGGACRQHGLDLEAWVQGTSLQRRLLSISAQRSEWMLASICGIGVEARFS